MLFYFDHHTVLLQSNVSLPTVNTVKNISNLDHVGIVLRNKKNQLFIFESTSNDGVGLTTWKDMIRYEWYKSTDKYSYIIN